MRRALRRFLIVEVGILRMQIAHAVMPSDLRVRTWRFWKLNPSVADEAVEIGEQIERIAKLETQLRQAAPFN